MGKFSRLGNDLYQGRRSIDFVHKRAIWYAVSITLVGLAILVIVVKGLNFGIEFTGGTQYRVDNLPASKANQETADELRDAIGNSSVGSNAAPSVTTSGDQAIIVQTEDLGAVADQEVRGIIKDVTGATDDQISKDDIGASWGRDVAKRAVIGVGIFLLLVVTGLLAILGFSMYDTVVVFDKIRENTHELRSSRRTYAEAANLAVNQTLVRSINTSIVALIPIGAILYVSAVQLGSSSLKDLALAQFVGMAAGVYSSVFIAPRVLVHLKSNETEVKLAEKRAKARARREADRYAQVPTFTEDMPVEDDLDDEGAHAEDAPVSTPAAAREPRAPEAMGRGRVVPEQQRPVRESRASGRQQPSRQPKSKRGKK
jgi:preprotein translocase subunit SecF